MKTTAISGAFVGLGILSLSNGITTEDISQLRQHAYPCEEGKLRAPVPDERPEPLPPAYPGAVTVAAVSTGTIGTPLPAVRAFPI
jgi:hypothetical protein